MRPHLTPKIRDEGLGGASKMMDLADEVAERDALLGDLIL